MTKLTSFCVLLRRVSPSIDLLWARQASCEKNNGHKGTPGEKSDAKLIVFPPPTSAAANTQLVHCRSGSVWAPRLITWMKNDTCARLVVVVVIVVLLAAWRSEICEGKLTENSRIQLGQLGRQNGRLLLAGQLGAS